MPRRLPLPYAKVGAAPAKAADAFLPVGTILPKRATDEDGDQLPGAAKEQMRYEEEIGIPSADSFRITTREVRFRITTREVLDDDLESTPSLLGVSLSPQGRSQRKERSHCI